MQHPEIVASIIPSSRFLERRLANMAVAQQARNVVELGPGTGGTTRAILNVLPENARLLAIELNREFVSLLNSDPHPALSVYEGSAEDLAPALQEHGMGPPDMVYSGIPFSNMPRETGLSILQAVWDNLAPGGTFVAYQFRSRVARLGREIMGEPESALEVLNLPPTRIFRWRKPAAAKAPLDADKAAS